MNCSKEIKEKPGYIRVLLEKNVVEHQKITDNHTQKTLHLRVMILLLFYVWEGARVWLVELISLIHIFTT